MVWLGTYGWKTMRTYKTMKLNYSKQLFNIEQKSFKHFAEILENFIDFLQIDQRLSNF